MPDNPADYVPVAIGATPTPWGVRVVVEKGDGTYTVHCLTTSDAAGLVKLLQEALADGEASFEQAFEQIATEEDQPE